MRAMKLAVIATALPNFATGLQWVFNGFAMGLQWVCNGSATAISNPAMVITNRSL